MISTDEIIFQLLIGIIDEELFKNCQLIMSRWCICSWLQCFMESGRYCTCQAWLLCAYCNKTSRRVSIIWGVLCRRKTDIGGKYTHLESIEIYKIFEVSQLHLLDSMKRKRAEQNFPYQFYELCGTYVHTFAMGVFKPEPILSEYETAVMPDEVVLVG